MPPNLITTWEILTGLNLIMIGVHLGGLSMKNNINILEDKISNKSYMIYELENKLSEKSYEIDKYKKFIKSKKLEEEYKNMLSKN